MMKKLTLILLSFALLCFSQEQNLSINQAIDEAIKYASLKLPAQTKVVVLNIKSESKKLSDYIIEESNIYIMNGTYIPLSPR